MENKETKQERALENYRSYLNKWDKYEQKVNGHFETKNIIRYGNLQNA